MLGGAIRVYLGLFHWWAEECNQGIPRAILSVRWRALITLYFGLIFIGASGGQSGCILGYYVGVLGSVNQGVFLAILSVCREGRQSAFWAIMLVCWGGIIKGVFWAILSVCREGNQSVFWAILSVC